MPLCLFLHYKKTNSADRIEDINQNKSTVAKNDVFFRIFDIDFYKNNRDIT